MNSLINATRYFGPSFSNSLWQLSVPRRGSYIKGSALRHNTGRDDDVARSVEAVHGLDRVSELLGSQAVQSTYRF